MADRKLPALPKAGPLGLIQYAGSDMHRYARQAQAELRDELRDALREIERLSFVGSHAEANKAIRAFICAHEAYAAGVSIPPREAGDQLKGGE